MCGRYQLIEAMQLTLSLNLPPIAVFKPRYNIAPQQKSWIVRMRDKEPVSEELRWGFRPAWLKDKNKAQINASAETVFSKPMFKHSAMNRRCLVLASGWYEWQVTPHGKQPYRIYLKDNCMFAFAGIWTTWHAEGEESQDVDSYAIITTEANSVATRIHPRMPVILGSKTCEDWLAVDENETRLKAMLRPYDGKDLYGYPVSNYVNSPKNTNAKCIEPLRS